MKKYIILALFLCALVVTPVFAQTLPTGITLEGYIAQLQDQIARLTAQLNQLLAQQNGGECYTFDRDLYVGLKWGPELVNLYNLLTREGISVDRQEMATFGYNENVAAAVVRLQAKYGIKQTGYFGPLTRAKLNSLYACKTSSVFITPSALANMKVGVRSLGDINMTAHGFDGGVNVIWSVVRGSLPTGLGLIPNGPCPFPPYTAAGVPDPNFKCPLPGASIMGMPTTVGTYAFIIQATNGTQTATQNYTLMVLGNNANAPIISGISGPTTLKVGEQGTWTIKASDPMNGNLSYGVSWGDEATYPTGAVTGTSKYSDQTGSFTHVYYRTGTFTPVFYVSNNSGQARSSLTVSITNSNQSNIINVLSPNGGEQWRTRSVQTIRWAPGPTVSFAPDAKVDLYLDQYYPPCTSQICPLAMPYFNPYTLDKNIAMNATYNWIVATDVIDNPIPAGNYYVRVCLAGSQTACDSSDQPFTITQ